MPVRAFEPAICHKSALQANKLVKPLPVTLPIGLPLPPGTVTLLTLLSEFSAPRYCPHVCRIRLLHPAANKPERSWTYCARCVVRKLRKWQSLLHKGEVWRPQCFIASRCCWLYRFDKASTDHMLRFAVENWWVTDHESYRTATPSVYNIEALAATTVLTWTKENWDELLCAIPALKAFYEQLRSQPTTDFLPHQRVRRGQIPGVSADVSAGIQPRAPAHGRLVPGYVARNPEPPAALGRGVATGRAGKIDRTATKKNLSELLEKGFGS